MSARVFDIIEETAGRDERLRRRAHRRVVHARRSRLRQPLRQLPAARVDRGSGTCSSRAAIEDAEAHPAADRQDRSHHRGRATRATATSVTRRRWPAAAGYPVGDVRPPLTTFARAGRRGPEARWGDRRCDGRARCSAGRARGPAGIGVVSGSCVLPGLTERRQLRRLTGDPGRTYRLTTGSAGVLVQVPATALRTDNNVLDPDAEACRRRGSTAHR